jgi:two-component system, chemotaxis family, sensor kinase CheA
VGKTPSMYETLLNAAAAQMPLIDKSDLSALAAIAGHLESLAAVNGAPKAFSTQASRAAGLAQNIIMAETDFDSGCKKLCDCLAKLQNSVRDMVDASEHAWSGTSPCEHSAQGLTKGSTDVHPAPQAQTVTEPSADNPSDLKELLVKFASTQQPVLEDFEAYILEYEKGDPQAKGAIKRVLHTWKGEFGVLDLGEYSAFIHRIEDMLEKDALNADGLFRLKDLLAYKLAALTTGVPAPLTESETGPFRETSAAASAYPTGYAASDCKPTCSQGSAPVDGNREVAPRSPRQDSDVAPQRTTSQDIGACDPSLLGDFINESRDHMHTAETLLLELETDPSNKENLNSIFRAWHTVKGVAGFLGLREIASLAHKMESQMDLARKGELALGPGPIDVFLEGNDCLKALIAAIEPAMKGEPFAIPESFDACITKLTSTLTNDTQASQSSSASPASAEKKVGEILVESGKASAEEVQAALQKQSNGDPRKIGEILLSEASVPARAVAGALAAQTSARQMKNVEETIRVPVNRIDQLVDSIGEAVIAQSMVNAAPLLMSVADQALATKIAHANTIMRQIQELAMSLRMVSVKSTFQKMARLARDLSKKCDRDLDFVTEGEDTELDKSVVENIGDPLIHMIRNSIDHGIEPREERATSGKPLKATVKLRAFHRAGSIFIEVMDDGKGLDKDAIYNKAVSKGLCKEGASLSDQEIFQFIFLPGFSTAKIVTDVSGRGVGMDVVRRNIEALRGSCEISSTPGKGTTFSIRLPLTLAIVDGMVVRAGDDKYIIPTLAILESLKATAEQVQTVLGRGKMISVRGELIILVHLAALLNRGKFAWDLTRGIVMIVEDMMGKKIGMFLDEIVGQQQVVIKSLGDGMHDIPGVTGGAIMSDGTVSLILDVGGIVKLAGESQRGGAFSNPGEELQSAA